MHDLSTRIVKELASLKRVIGEIEDEMNKDMDDHTSRKLKRIMNDRIETFEELKEKYPDEYLLYKLQQ